MRLSEHLEGLALVEAAPSEAALALADILSRYGAVGRTDLPDWPAVKRFLLPLKSFPTRYALIPYAGWTVILGDMRLEMCHVDALGISKSLGGRAASAYFRERTRHFHVAMGGQAIRDITCYDDGGGWSFFQSGEPAPWEDLDAYSRRRVRDRLTKERVLEYLKLLVGAEFPPEWRRVAPGALGVERSTRDLQVPIRPWTVDEDL